MLVAKLKTVALQALFTLILLVVLVIAAKMMTIVGPSVRLQAAAVAIMAVLISALWALNRLIEAVRQKGLQQHVHD